MNIYLLANKIQGGNQCKRIVLEFSLIFRWTKVGTTAYNFFCLIKGLEIPKFIFKLLRNLFRNFPVRDIWCWVGDAWTVPERVHRRLCSLRMVLLPIPPSFCALWQLSVCGARKEIFLFIYFGYWLFISWSTWNYPHLEGGCLGIDNCDSISLLPCSIGAPGSSAWRWLPVPWAEGSSLGSGWWWLLELFPLPSSKQYVLLSRICLEFQTVNLLLLPMTCATPWFVSLVPPCGQISKGPFADLGFPGEAGSSPQPVWGYRLRNSCSVDCTSLGAASVEWLPATGNWAPGPQCMCFYSPAPWLWIGHWDTWAQLPKFHTQLVKGLLAEGTARLGGFGMAALAEWIHTAAVWWPDLSEERHHAIPFTKFSATVTWSHCTPFCVRFMFFSFWMCFTIECFLFKTCIIYI